MRFFVENVSVGKNNTDFHDIIGSISKELQK